MAVKTGDVARDTRHVDLLNLRSGLFFPNKREEGRPHRRLESAR